jgi:hypothetical protein
MEVIFVALIRELIEQYSGEWLAIEVIEEKDGRPYAGKLIYHSHDRDEVWQKTKELQRVYIVYAGSPLKEGYAAVF